MYTECCCMFMYMCACICVHIYAEARWLPWMLFFRCHTSCFWDRITCQVGKAGWTANSRDPPVSTSNMHCHAWLLCGFWGETQALHLYSKLCICWVPLQIMSAGYLSDSEWVSDTQDLGKRWRTTQRMMKTGIELGFTLFALHDLCRYPKEAPRPPLLL